MSDSANDEAGAAEPVPLPSLDPSSSSISDLLSYLTVDANKGLTGVEASERLSAYGPNSLTQPDSRSILSLIVEQFDDRLVQILLAVAAVSAWFGYFEMREESIAAAAVAPAADSAVAAAKGDSHGVLRSFAEPLVILSILILNAAVDAWQSKSAEGSIEALKSLQPSLASVLRDGTWADGGVDASDLVPGDIISSRAGDKVSANARLLSLRTSSMSADEGSLTGESCTVQKVPGDDVPIRRYRIA